MFTDKVSLYIIFDKQYCLIHQLYIILIILFIKLETTGLVLLEKRKNRPNKVILVKN